MFTDRQIVLFITVVFLITQMASCGFVSDEKLIGPYCLVAVDLDQQMSICYQIDKGDCVGRIPETIFALGWDEHYIVAKQHPAKKPPITNYFVIDISRDSKYADPAVSVIGPLSASEFEEKRVLLGLPAFIRSIDSLK